MKNAIVSLAGRINAATYDLLVLIRRFDERAGWLGWGFDSCAEWLHWRCDISKSAAREKVRTAHALKTLPAIGAAFAAGRLSYTKVRALTRVADAANEDELLAFALGTTAPRVEERCRELRYGLPASTDEAVRAHARRGLILRRDAERGVMTLTVELPLETGELVERALDRVLEAAVATAPAPEAAGETWTAQRADALVTLARAYLSGEREGTARAGSAGSADRYQVTVHVDASALRGGAGRSGLPIESVRRLACDADVVELVEDEAGEPLSVGRKRRAASAAIRRALWARDQGCRFPGCERTRFVDVHHVEHWSCGGETSLGNTLLLCGTHHRLVHEGRFRIETDYQDRWFFRRPDGRAVPACGYRPEDTADDDGAAAARLYLGDGASAEASSGDGPSAEVIPSEAPSAEASSSKAPSAEVFSSEASSVEGSLAAWPSAEAWRDREPAEPSRIKEPPAEAYLVQRRRSPPPAGCQVLGRGLIVREARPIARRC